MFSEVEYKVKISNRAKMKFVSSKGMILKWDWNRRDFIGTPYLKCENFHLSRFIFRTKTKRHRSDEQAIQHSQTSVTMAYTVVEHEPLTFRRRRYCLKRSVRHQFWQQPSDEVRQKTRYLTQCKLCKPEVQPTGYLIFPLRSRVLSLILII